MYSNNNYIHVSNFFLNMLLKTPWLVNFVPFYWNTPVYNNTLSALSKMRILLSMLCHLWPDLIGAQIWEQKGFLSLFVNSELCYI